MDASASSPHLRKSGSWAVVSDFGAFEPGSGFEEEALLHGLEANEMKGVSIPSSTTAPSPVLLWRLKISWDSVMRMSLNLRDLFLYEAFLYYNPLLLVTLVVWFWGMNLWVFSQANVDFARIFDVDRNHLTHREIWKVTPSLQNQSEKSHLPNYEISKAKVHESGFETQPEGTRHGNMSSTRGKTLSSP
ncbi:putative protein BRASSINAZOLE-RESISTANT 1-like [Capsicum annuum]|nr:putative protein BRASSINAZOLE-RESISTANT 1-like [Capsicum annuum]